MTYTRGILLTALLAAPLGAQALDDTRLEVETWTAGLSLPISLAFVGPDEMLVVQNVDGKVIRVKDGVAQNEALDVTVTNKGGRGIATHPDFPATPWVYVYYAAAATDGGAWTESRLERYTYDGTNLGGLVGPLFTLPYDVGQANPDGYNAGIIRFGPDGMIYGQVGDKARGRLANPRIEQNTGASASALAGAIFRLQPDGGVPPDNPFVAEAETALHPWYVYGFRNSIGMDFDPITGDLWFTDNSSGDYDEVNRAGSGMNSGWLKIMGPDARDVTYTTNGNQVYDADDLVYPGGAFYRDPEFSFKEGVGITALCFLSSKRFPEDLRDVILVGDSVLGQLYRLDPDAAREHLVLTSGLADRVADDATERDAVRFGSGFSIITDIVIGGDGYAYLVDYYGGAILRIRPLVDLFEPVEMTVVAGALESGTVAELELSDDRTVRIGPAGAQAILERCALEAEMRLNGTQPQRIDLTVESRANRATGLQRVELYHAPSATWRLVDRRPLTTVDQVVTVLDIEDPSEYVDPTERTLRVRVTHRAPGRALRWLGGSTGAPPLRSFVDQVRLSVTWPR